MKAGKIARYGTIPISGIVFCIVLTGCVQSAFLRGTVEDISGEELPGAVVRVSGTEYEGLSNANGHYGFRTVSGTLDVVFLKTGYTSVHKQVVVPSLGVLDVDAVQLWPLPVGEGVYAFQQNKYTQTDHPRVNGYRLQDAGIAYGTPVEPSLVLRYVDPETDPEGNPPRLYAHRLPAYDARLHKLHQVKAAQAQSAGNEGKDKDRKGAQYNEEIWVPEETIPLMSRPVDEPEHLLLELRPTRPLAPGVYAIHWGALDGYDGIDHRAFLFAVREEKSDVEIHAEGEEGESEEKETTSETDE